MLAERRLSLLLLQPGCIKIQVDCNRKVRRGNWIKWMIWFPWIGSIALLAVKAGGYSSIDVFYKTVYGFSISDLPSLIAYFVVLFVLIILPDLILGRRSFCHHLCWMAPFMIIGRKLANITKVTSLQLTVASENCVHCHRCTENCPMSLPVEALVETRTMEHSECILCGTCADTCMEKTIALVFK